MKPSWPRIIQIVSSGLGLGLIALLVLARLAHGQAPSQRWWTAIGAALLYITAGLLAAATQLRRRGGFWLMLRRSWRARWSREWLSLLAVFPMTGAYIAALQYAPRPVQIGCGIALIGLALIALLAMTMTQAGIAAVPSWRSLSMGVAVPVQALMSAAVAIVAMFPAGAPIARAIALPLLFAALMFKLLHYANASRRGVDDAAATLGLPVGASLRRLERSRGSRNVITHDMMFDQGYGKLWGRRLSMFALAYLIPFALLVPVSAEFRYSTLFGIVATASCIAGLLLERWLSYAEARHLSSMWRR